MTLFECLCYILGMTKHTRSLEHLLEKPVFNTNDARSAGIPPRMLAYYCKQGLIDRVGRGIYRSPSAETGLQLDFEELVLTATTIPHGVICLISALCFYGLTDQIMREYWIAVPNTDKSPKRPHTRIVRMRNMTLGKTTISVGQYKVQIFDRERTVIDAFRYLSREVAIKAIQTYLKSSLDHKPDLTKLSKYANILKVNITPYIQALTT